MVICLLFCLPPLHPPATMHPQDVDVSDLLVAICSVLHQSSVSLCYFSFSWLHLPLLFLLASFSLFSLGQQGMHQCLSGQFNSSLFDSDVIKFPFWPCHEHFQDHSTHIAFSLLPDPMEISISNWNPVVWPSFFKIYFQVVICTNPGPDGSSLILSLIVYHISFLHGPQCLWVAYPGNEGSNLIPHITEHLLSGMHLMNSLISFSPCCKDLL